MTHQITININLTFNTPEEVLRGLEDSVREDVEYHMANCPFVKGFEICSLSATSPKLTTSGDTSVTSMDNRVA